MKKLTLEDLPWSNVGTSVELEDLQKPSPLLKHIDEIHAELSKQHQHSYLPINTTYADIDFAQLEDFTKCLEPPQPILSAFERVANQIAEKLAQAEAERFLRMFTEPWLPTYTRQAMAIMQDNQKAQDFFERYIQPEIKPLPIEHAIQTHLNKESDHD